MRLLKLTIHNLASIEHAEIDFASSVLKDEPLFLITGDTGSGKTTIVDAICLALYKQTPRLAGDNGEQILDFTTYKDKNNNPSKTYTNNTKLLLRRNSVEAYVILEFEDNNEIKYIARWEVAKAHKKNDGNVLDDKHFLTNCKTGITLDNKKDIEKEVERCTGMNFKQFCRTSVLAQGEFTKFLKSKENEKSEILETLTGTEIYSKISMNIFEITKQKEALLERKKAEISGIKLLSEEEKSDIEKSLKEKNLLLEENNKKIEKENEKINWLKQSNLLNDNLISTENQLKQARDYLSSQKNTDNQKNVILWHQTEKLRAEIDLLNALNNQLNARKKESFQYKSRYLSLNYALKTLEQKTVKLKETYDTIDKNIKLLNEEIDTLNGQKKACDYDKLSKDYTDEISRKENLITLNSLYDLFCKNTNLLKDSEIKKQNLQQEENCYIQRLDTINKQIQQAQNNFNLAEQRYEKIADSLDSWAKKTRLKLSENDICPLCGQKIKQVFDDKHFRDLVTPLKEDLDKCQKEYDDLRIEKSNCQTFLIQIQKDSLLLDSQINNQKKDCLDTEEKMKNICQKLDIEYNENINKEFLNITVQQSDKRIKELFSLIDKINDINNSVNQKQGIVDMYLRQKHTIETDNMIVSSCKAAKKSIEEFTENWENETDNSFKITDLVKQWNELRDDFISWKDKVFLLRENIKEKEKYINSFYNENPDITPEKIKDLMQYSGQSIQIIEKEISDIKENISKYESIKNHIISQIEEHNQNIPLIKSEENLNTMEKNLHILKQESDKLQFDIGGLTDRLNRDKEYFSVYENALKETGKLQTQYDKWQDLNKLFGSKDGKQFRTIAQGFILGDLLDKANYYLKRFSDRFELFCQPPGLTILIKDKYEGDLALSSGTLSGGESFMVSLSLALGLSQMNSNNSYMDILFIDEGFGTLSANCLNTVMQTLEKLHTIGGRKVGIISHISELKERISAQIQVKRTDNTKSEVKLVRV